MSSIVVDTSVGLDDAWDNYVRCHASGTICHLSAWRNLISGLFGHQTYYLSIRSKTNQVIGILPLVRLKSLLFGDFMISMPYLNYGGALADSDVEIRSLMERANDLAAELGVNHVEYRHTFSLPDSIPVRTDKVAMILDLPAAADDLAQSLGTKRRTQIRRSQKEGANVRHGNTSLLDDFYLVFSRHMRDLGTPVYPKSFFGRILNTFPENCHLIVIDISGKPAAAAFLLGSGQRMEIPWASSLRKYNSIRVNMLLYWEALQFSIAGKYQQFDFGRSTIDSGTFLFKRQWGAMPQQLYWHYWLRFGNGVPQLNPDNPKYRFAIAAWQRMPVLFANFLGPRIVRYLP